ncbi:MAG: ABC transporter permease [Acidobacteria bacterium]|nr:ABC transporter permease [Acidobacteriota bacterium]
MRALSDLAQDARWAIRGMRRTPGFTAVALVTLALGIGANTAVFSVLYGVWLSPPAYPRPQGLVDVSGQQRSGHRFLRGASHRELSEWRSQTKTLQDFGVHRYVRSVNISGEPGAEEATAHRVSSNLFDLLGARPALGSPLDSAADRAAGPRQVLIGYDWWRRRFGADPGVLGRNIRVDGEAFAIAGVMPQGFEFPPMSSASYRPVLWMSLNATPLEVSDPSLHSLAVIARLRDGTSIGQARAELDAIAARTSVNDGWGVTVRRLNDNSPLDNARPSLVLLMAASSLVLLAACANIANLLLARGVGRASQMRMRRVLGATSGRLARQILTESALLALAGGVAGTLLACALLPVLKSALPAAMPRASQIALSIPVLCFAAGVSIVTSLLFGALPALRGGRDPGTTLAGRSIAAPSRAVRALIALEVALAVVLLAGAGLLIESFRRVMNVDLGFDQEHALTLRLQLTKSRYPDAARIANFRDDLLRQAAQLPGVQYAGTVSSLPMGIVMQGRDFEIEGQPETSRDKPFADFASVSRDYLRAMGIALAHGRYFDPSDRPTPSPVAIISESLAKAHWPAGQALGAHIRFDNAWFTIVGTVADVRQYSPERGARGGTIYALNEQLPLETQSAAISRLIVLVLRTAGDPAPVAAGVRRIVAGMDQDQPIADVSTMRQIVWNTLAPRRLNTLLVALFAGLAIALAAAGVFGVTAYAVARRTREIGIRMAMGAAPGSILRMVARETLLTAAIGAIAGVGAAAALSRFIAGFLYGVQPADPLILTAVAAALIVIVSASALPPARRAMRVDPVVALRQD